ncbi:MAG TPA: DUF6484 domain-containing protein [Myxococcaceae bacterium]|nr:DUF6484 domain-containing protein [Myxococcaceae bacterium]
MKTNDSQSKTHSELQEQEEPLLGSRIGWLTASPSGALLVDFEGNRLGPLPARTTVPLTPEQHQRAIISRQSVVLMFENGERSKPLILGLVQEVSASPLVDAILEELPTPERVEAIVDGKPRIIEIEGEEEIVLRCGEASITLRRNGKILIRGSYVETRASGTNRIKGGSVQIN